MRFAKSSAKLILCAGVFTLTACSFLQKKVNYEPERFPQNTPQAPAAAIPKLTKTLFLSSLANAESFTALSQASTGIIRQGETIKVFIDNRNSANPVVYFMNANYCAASSCAAPPPEAVSHYAFAKKTLSGFAMSELDYSQAAYFTTNIKDRKFFDARIQKFTIPENGVDKTYYGIRFIERDLINNEMIQHAITAILKKMQIPGQNISYIINSQSQQVTAILPWLQSQNITYFTMERILSGINYIGLNPGVAYGFLRVDPENEDELEPFDIPLFSSLPLDLAVVAGTITTEFQDVGSHVNLKSKERGTPNMVVRDAQQIQALHNLNGQPIKLSVTYEGFSFERVSPDLVYSEYNKKINKPWKMVTQVNDDKLVHFDDMCSQSKPADCLKKSSSYGGKVAGLGFLAHPAVAGNNSALSKAFGYKLNPMGFGVPLSFYNEFMRYNLEKNPELKRLYDLLINSELSLNGARPLQALERKQLIDQLKIQIMHSTIPEALYKRTYNEVLNLKQRVNQVYASQQVDLDKLKIRSSSNAEDIEGFNGAGLHDSYSAKISNSKDTDFSFTDCQYVMSIDDDTGLNEEDVQPKSLACAMKASYASLWNLRAVRERSYKRFDHRSASMGLSVQTSYKFRKDMKIKSNSVLVTRVVGTESVYGQQISTQVGNGLVTNPLPNTKSELVVVSFDVSAKNVSINILQYAKPQADQPALTNLILTENELKQMSKIARDVEVAYCEAKTIAVYFPGAKSCSQVVNSAKKALSLDMEFKQYNNGQFLIKQVRTFTGR